jgi:hypothetical protein
MTNKEWESLGVQTYGLTQDLIVPVAAADTETIEKYVGIIRERIPGRKRPINAVVVEAQRPNRNPLVPLWNECEADHYYRCLHPSRQLWVHVDYGGYRRAWARLGFDELTREVVLDHIRNRAVVRFSGYRHPFLRLCPVSKETNTSSGLDNGQEGMQKVELRKLNQQPTNIRQRTERRLAAPVVLADPIDMTKMLDIPPGLTELHGVALMLKKFYTRTE